MTEEIITADPLASLGDEKPGFILAMRETLDILLPQLEGGVDHGFMAVSQGETSTFVDTGPGQPRGYRSEPFYEEFFFTMSHNRMMVAEKILIQLCRQGIRKISIYHEIRHRKLSLTPFRKLLWEWDSTRPSFGTPKLKRW